MTTALVTVGIPFYNCENCLLDSIRSVFAQTYTNWELILVDDGSTDGSLDIARSIDDRRVRVLPADGKNRHLPARLNQITQAAKGDYIARMDADDLSHPERFARQLDFLQTHPDVDVVGTYTCILDKEDQPTQKSGSRRTNEEIFKNKFKNGVSIGHPTIMGKTEWFRQWPYDENKIRCQDYELWVRSCKNSFFCNIPELLYFKNEIFSFEITKYTKSKHSLAQVIWRYAPPEIGTLATVYYASRCYLQISVYAGAKLVGLHRKLINRRYRPLTVQERAELCTALDVIRKTEVPTRNMK